MEEDKVVTPVPAQPTLLELDDLEERKAKRSLKYWAIRKLFLVGGLVVVAATGAITLDAYQSGKELNTGFFSEVLGVLVDFAKYLYQG